MASFRGAVAVVALTAWSAAAEKKTVVVAVGDCADPALITGARDFRDAAGKLLGASLVEGETVLDIVRPRALRSRADLERQLDSARALFYGGQADRAAELSDRVLEQLERAPPDAAIWPLTSGALVLKALIAKNADKPKEMAETFRRVVRVDPSFTMDADAFPPSAIAAFEQVRQEVARARKTAFFVQVDQGPQASVFLDGKLVGTSPLRIDLIPGTYRLVLEKKGAVSFPHRVEIPKDKRIALDFAFEGSVSTQAPVCLSQGTESSAVKLAQLVTAEQVVVLRNTAARGEPPYFSGALFELSSGREERSGSVQAGSFENLAIFLITGRKLKDVDTQPAPPVAAPVPARVDPEPVPQKPTEVVLTPQPAAPVTQVAQPSPVRPVSSASPVSPARALSWTLLAAGAASVISGVVAYLAFEPMRAELAVVMPNGVLPDLAHPQDRERAFQLMDSVAGNSLATGLLLGFGVGGAAAGIVGLTLFPAAPATVAVAPSSTGATITVRGTF